MTPPEQLSNRSVKETNFSDGKKSKKPNKKGPQQVAVISTSPSFKRARKRKNGYRGGVQEGGLEVVDQNTGSLKGTATGNPLNGDFPLLGC